MSLMPDIGAACDDIAEWAKMLQEEYDKLFLAQPVGSAVRNDLHLMKLQMSGLKMAALRLATLTASARMTEELPARATERTDTARAAFLRSLHAAGDYTFEDREEVAG